MMVLTSKIIEIQNIINSEKPIANIHNIGCSLKDLTTSVENMQKLTNNTTKLIPIIFNLIVFFSDSTTIFIKLNTPRQSNINITITATAN